jgi:hypothetical protein
VRPKGTALFKYQKWIGGSDVVFGEVGDATLLGVLTGLSLDPIGREPKRMTLMM